MPIQLRRLLFQKSKPTQVMVCLPSDMGNLRHQLILAFIVVSPKSPVGFQQSYPRPAPVSIPAPVYRSGSQAQPQPRSPLLTGNTADPAIQTTPSSNSVTSDLGASVESNGYAGTAGGRDDLPEQRIFPGVVHERTRRNSLSSPETKANNSDGKEIVQSDAGDY